VKNLDLFKHIYYNKAFLYWLRRILIMKVEESIQKEVAI
jgi:hypothetical protein